MVESIYLQSRERSSTFSRNRCWEKSSTSSCNRCRENSSALSTYYRNRSGNRYLEEVEQLFKPGFVAEMVDFYELYITLSAAFSRNPCYDEVKQFSKSGFVAEKKAFFEAEYKKRAAMKAAALLEQLKATVDVISEE